MSSAEPIIRPRNRSIEGLNPYRSKMVISTREGYFLIEKASIRYVEANGNYCFIHIKNRHKILYSKPLKYIESKLGSHQFCKIHQSYLVNVHSITFVDPSFSRVQLECGQTLPVSRSKKETLRLCIRTMFD